MAMEIDISSTKWLGNIRELLSKPSPSRQTDTKV
jgi:hypothetical protein